VTYRSALERCPAAVRTAALEAYRCFPFELLTISLYQVLANVEMEKTIHHQSVQIVGPHILFDRRS
jgi:hypothetical protein